MPARKKSKADKSSLPGAPSKRGRLPAKIQRELAEFNRPGFIANDWWELQEADSSWDLAAGFCWEVLRRHPVGRVLEKLEEAIEGDLQLELDYHSTRPKGPGPICPLQYEIDHRYGQEVLNAIRCFTALSRHDFASLHERDGQPTKTPRPISPWLLNYRSLWIILDEKGRVPSSAIEHRDPLMSERNPKGKACMNLVRPAPSSDAPSGVAPVEGYDPEPVLGISIWTSYQSPSNSDRPRCGDCSHLDDPDEGARSSINHHLGIRYGELETQLAKLGMRPLVLAVREDAPKKQILGEIGEILDGLIFPKSRSNQRKIETRSFDVLKLLDQEVIKEEVEVVSSGTAKNFLRSAALKPESFIRSCRDHLAQRRKFFKEIGIGDFQAPASSIVPF